MIPIKDIERVYEIIDRELSFLELQPKANRRSSRIENWLFVRDRFQKVLMDCAKVEGIFKL